MKIPQSKQTGNALVYVLLILVMVAILAMAGFWLVNKSDNYVNTITKDGIITEIQTLSRLQTVAYGVDTIVTADKAGTWQNLWQDKQKGLFIIKGRVLGGVDLGGISAEMVQISQTKNEQGETIDRVHITLPPSQVFEVFLDDIEVYDWQTGYLVRWQVILSYSPKCKQMPKPKCLPKLAKVMC